jgi:hypothetical protein
VPALFDYIHPSHGNGWREKCGFQAGWNEWRQPGGENQSEGIHRPDGGMIVIVRIDQFWPVLAFVDRRDVIEMRMHGSRMIVIMIGPRSGMNVLKRRDKKCQ